MALQRPAATVVDLPTGEVTAVAAAAELGRSAVGASVMLSEWLAWSTCGLCLLLALVTSLITYHPNVQDFDLVLPAIFAGLAILAGRIAFRFRRLPPTHRLS